MQRSYRPGQITLAEVCVILHIIHVNHNNSTAFSLHDYALGPVVRRALSDNPWLNFNPGFSFVQKSNHQIVDKKNYTEFAFYSFISEITFRHIPGLHLIAIRLS